MHSSRTPHIAVVGSLNTDHTLRVPHLPAPGETLTAFSALTAFGGKGANQAVAAARAGARVTLIGCIGDDDPGTRYLCHLRAEHIVTEAILRSPSPTGSAFIAVDDRGENTILVHPGANHQLTPAHIDLHAERIRSADALLLQLECPLPAVHRAASIARDAGVRVLLNPSPWSSAYRDAGTPADVLIVNAHEASELTGLPLEHALADIPQTLQRARCSMLVITRGSASTLTLQVGQPVLETPAHRVLPVDTVGAGDTFAGYLAAALSEACPSGQAVPSAETLALSEALRIANGAAALATLKPGAQTALPSRPEVQAFLLTQPAPSLHP